MNKQQTLNTINLIQGYYRYLYVSSFLEEVIKYNDLSNYAVDIPIKTGDKSSFVLKGNTIKNILKDIYNNPDKPNIFGHFTQLVTFNQITSGIRELIENSEEFKKFLVENLGKQYFPFEQIIKFTRNCLSHATTTSVVLKTEDYEKQKLYLMSIGNGNLIFNFKYSKSFPNQWKGNEEYGLKIALNFDKIRQGKKFLDIISLHQLFILSELCFNLTEIFKNKK